MDDALVPLYYRAKYLILPKDSKPKCSQQFFEHCP
jgi:hypothetical protein